MIAFIALTLLVGRQDIRPVKTEQWGAGVVICLERDAFLMPLTLTVSCFSKIQTGFIFVVAAHPGGPEKRTVKRVCMRCVCVCVCVLLVVHHTPRRRCRSTTQQRDTFECTIDAAAGPTRCVTSICTRVSHCCIGCRPSVAVHRYSRTAVAIQTEVFMKSLCRCHR